VRSSHCRMGGKMTHSEEGLCPTQVNPFRVSTN
jgi:hypothetical protein